MRIACDFILGHTGFRPDRTLFEELQVQLCYVTEGPIRLAAHLLREQGGDCLNQTLPTEDLLTTSEPDFFILGNKSTKKLLIDWHWLKNTLTLERSI